MGLITKTYQSWRAAKWICLSYLLSFAAGGLLHSRILGRIKEADKPAMFILVLTVFAFVVILGTVGIHRWKKGELDAFEKRFVVFSLAMYPTLFVTGWCLNIFR